MTQAEYDAINRGIVEAYDDSIKALNALCIKENARAKVGDIIKSQFGRSIKVKRISLYSVRPLSIIYYGLKVCENGQVHKRLIKSEIRDNDLISINGKKV